MMRLERGVARLLDDGGAVRGAGFLVGPQTLFTCAHVLTAAGHTLGSAVHMDFPAADYATARGTVVALVPKDREGHADVAVVALDAPAPAATEPVRLAVIDDMSDHRFETMGFPFDVGVWAVGMLRGPTPPDWVQLEATSGQGYEVQRGFSGAPVLDRDLEAVVGMIVAADRSPGPRVGWAVRIAVALDACPPEWRPDDVAGNADEALERRYRELVLGEADIANLSTPFGAVPPDYYMPRLLRPIGDNSPAPAIPVDDAITNHDRIVMIGAAGMGKSELLHDIARRMASGELVGLPVLVRLHDLSARGDRDLLQFAIENRFADRLRRDELESVVGLLKERAGPDGDVTFLFDGLDEVPTSALDDVLTRVRRTSRFVLTSRPTGRIEVLQDAGATFAIQDLAELAVTQFVNHWSAEQRDISALLDRIADDVVLADLVRVPQLLLLLCWVWRPTSTTYQDRSDLLAHAIDEAFRQAVRLSGLAGGNEDILPHQARRMLRRLALELLTTGDGSRSTITSERLLDAAMDEGGPQAGPLTGLARRSGLLVPASASGGDFQFLHLVFRDFLAAEAVAKAADPGPMLDVLVARPAAQECLIIASALETARMPDAVLERLCARQPDIFGMNWYLAALCLRAVPKLDRYADRLVRVEDGVLAGAREWWSRGHFAPAIGCLRTERMRTRLVADLGHDDAYARWAAVEGLRRFGDPTVLPALRERLEVEEWVAVRSALALTLAHLRDEAGEETIWAVYERRKALELEYTDFFALGEAFGRLKADDAIRRLIAEAPASQSAVDAVIGAHPFVGPPLDAEIDVALAAAGVTFRRADDDWEALDEVLLDEDVSVEARQHAARRLGAIGSAAAAYALIAGVMTSTEAGVRDVAAQEFVQFEGDVDLADMISSVVDQFLWSEEENRIIAARAIVSLWTSAAQTAMANLGWPDPSVTAMNLVGDEDVIVRTAAAVMTSLGGSPPVSLLTELMRDENPMIAAAAIAAAGWAQDVDLVPSILEAATTHLDSSVRLAALNALGNLACRDAVPILTKALKADSVGERSAAARSLGRLGDTEGLSALAGQLPVEPEGSVRVAILDAMEGMAGRQTLSHDLVATLVASLRGEEAEVRAATARVLGAAGDLQAAESIRVLMETDPSDAVRDEAAKAYGRVAGEDRLVALIDELGRGASSMYDLAALVFGLDASSEAQLSRLMTRVVDTGGSVLVTERVVTAQYPSIAYTLIRSDVPRDLDELLADADAEDPGRRWGAVNGLGDYWREQGVLGHLAVAMIDEHPAVAARATGIVVELADSYVLSLDSEDRRQLSRPGVLSGLISLIGDGTDAGRAAASLLADIQFLPDLMRALASGQVAVRESLWEIADRNRLRLMADGRAILPSGDAVPWEDVATASVLR